MSFPEPGSSSRKTRGVPLTGAQDRIEQREQQGIGSIDLHRAQGRGGVVLGAGVGALGDLQTFRAMTASHQTLTLIAARGHDVRAIGDVPADEKHVDDAGGADSCGTMWILFPVIRKGNQPLSLVRGLRACGEGYAGGINPGSRARGKISFLYQKYIIAALDYM